MAQRDHLGVGSTGDDLQQPGVVHVLVSEHDQPEILDPAAVLCQRALEGVKCGAGVRAGVDERQWLVLDQVAIHAPDEERVGIASA